MAKGSQSQASSTVSKGGSSAVGAGRTGPAGLGPRGSAAASSSSAGLRKRRTSSSGSGGSGGGFGGNGNMLRFYTDDAPGLKISPTVVLAMSLCFIGFVTALHVAGKLYNYRAGSA